MHYSLKLESLIFTNPSHTSALNHAKFAVEECEKELEAVKISEPESINEFVIFQIY